MPLRTSAPAATTTGSADTDHELLLACLAGSEAAFAALCARHTSACLELASRLLRDPLLAEECVLQAFVDLWHARAGLVTERAPVGDVVVSMTRRRAVERGGRHRRPSAPPVASPSDRYVALADGLLTAGGDRQTERLLAGVPVVERCCLVLAHWGGFTVQEIAELTNTPVGTVRDSLASALARMRDLVTPSAPTDGGSRVLA